MSGIHWMPDVPTVMVNPGWFADNYHMAGLEKVLRADRSIPDFQIAQVLSYLEEYRRDAFAVGAPTSAVLEVGGREPEEFKVIVRRYLAANRNAARILGSFGRTLLAVLKTMVTPTLDLDDYTRRADLPRLQSARYTGESAEWGATHGSCAGRG